MIRRLVVCGVVATFAAVVATTVAAALAGAVGVDFEVSNSDETIPLSGIAVVTGFFSAVGVLIAAALLRWSARPADRFLWVAGSLTLVSLIPPVLFAATTGTTIALVCVHLVAAAVMIPALARALRTE